MRGGEDLGGCGGWISLDSSRAVTGWQHCWDNVLAARSSPNQVGAGVLAVKGRGTAMTSKTAAVGLLATALVSTMSAQEGRAPQGVPHLDHVFVIMMENHGYSQILNNPNAPFTNQYAKSANAATNYFAIAHPSLTNYLEVVGGSNFGVQTDNYPDWHNKNCATNLASGVPATDNPSSGVICPVARTGTDAATPAIDYTNETQGPPGEINIDGKQSIAADKQIAGKTIADQLAANGMRWQSDRKSVV